MASVTFIRASEVIKKDFDADRDYLKNRSKDVLREIAVDPGYCNNLFLRVLDC